MGNEETAAPRHETSVGMFPCNVIFFRILWHFDMLQAQFNLQNNLKKKSIQPKVAFGVSRMKLPSYTSHLKKKKKTLQEQGVR